MRCLRANPSVLEDLTFTEYSDGAINRLRVGVALLNDLHTDDHSLARLIFSEELKMKRRYKHYHIEHLKLYGLLLTKFRSIEDLWILFEAHKLDRKFNIEFALSLGVFQVHSHVETVEHELKRKLQRAIGSSYQKSKFSEVEVAQWRNVEEYYFLLKYRFTEMNQLHIAALLEDAFVVNELLPDWVAKHKTWTKQDAQRYALYSIVTDDLQTKIKSRELYIERFDDDFSWMYMNHLVELYIMNEQYQKAINLFMTMLGKTNKQILRVHYLKRLRRIIRLNEKKHPKNRNEALQLVKAVDEEKRDLLTLIENAISNANRLSLN